MRSPVAGNDDGQDRRAAGADVEVRPLLVALGLLGTGATRRATRVPIRTAAPACRCRAQPRARPRAATIERRYACIRGAFGTS